MHGLCYSASLVRSFSLIVLVFIKWHRGTKINCPVVNSVMLQGKDSLSQFHSVCASLHAYNLQVQELCKKKSFYWSTVAHGLSLAASQTPNRLKPFIHLLGLLPLNCSSYNLCWINSCWTVFTSNLSFKYYMLYVSSFLCRK